VLYVNPVSVLLYALNTLSCCRNILTQYLTSRTRWVEWEMKIMSAHRVMMIWKPSNHFPHVPATPATLNPRGAINVCLRPR
jgi:hypothetical protein